MTLPVCNPLFSSRYGINDHHPDGQLWRQRHLADPAAVRTSISCVCPGGALDKARNPCRQVCTQEDFLCDECRTWCWAVGSDATREPVMVCLSFVQLYGPAAPAPKLDRMRLGGSL